MNTIAQYLHERGMSGDGLHSLTSKEVEELIAGYLTQHQSVYIHDRIGNSTNDGLRCPHRFNVICYDKRPNLITCKDCRFANPTNQPEPKTT